MADHTLTREQVVAYVLDHPGQSTREICDGLGEPDVGKVNAHLTRAATIDRSIVQAGRRGRYTWHPPATPATTPTVSAESVRLRIAEIESQLGELARELRALTAYLAAWESP